MNKPQHPLHTPFIVHGNHHTRIEAHEPDELTDDYLYYFIDENGELDKTYKDFIIIKN